MKPAGASDGSNAEFNRRQFLGTSARAAGALAMLPTSGGAKAEGTHRWTVGFLGTGYSHFAAKYELLRQSSEYELVGLCEEDAEVRARGPAGARWLTVNELFDQAEVVVVESAVKHHARDARRALAAGCHVHLEKPPADSLAGLHELLELAAEKRRLLQIGYMWREHPGLNLLLAAARDGFLGDLYLARALINTHGGPSQRQEWAQFGGGILFELGCHLLDPMVRLLGTPTQVQSSLQKNPAADDRLTDNTTVILEFPRALGVLTCSARQPGAGSHRSFELLGTNGWARLQPIEPPTLVMDLVEPAGPYAKGRQEIPLPPYRRYESEFSTLARALRTGQPLAITAAEELAVQSALMQACRM